ncbi:MAG: diphthine--ammonia ligase [bacterium]
MNNRIAAGSWSGGKDSCLAVYKALQMGYDIQYLVSFISKEHKRGCFHGIEHTLLQKQAESIGIPLFLKEVTADMKQYEIEFKEAVRSLKTQGINAMVFGDIYLNEQKNWVERVCGDLRIEMVEPLWHKPAEDIVREFIDLGFKTVVVSCQANLFGKEFIGRLVDTELLEELKNKKICPCGENGEFHTFVADGPIFKNKIELVETETIRKKGFWEYWQLDIKKYEVVPKAVQII